LSPPTPPHLLLFFLRIRRSPTSTLFPYTTLFRSFEGGIDLGGVGDVATDTEQAFRWFPGSVGHRDVVSTLSQFTGDGQADSPVAAGDQYRARHRKAPHFPAAAVISHDVGSGVWERIAAYRATNESYQPGFR